MVIKALYQIQQPQLTELPQGSFRYCSMKWASHNLPECLMDLVSVMANGITEPRVSYILRHLEVNERFGHGKWHLDGFGKPEEIHRLLTFNGTPTEGLDGTILHAGTVWEFSGDYYHRAKEATIPCLRLLLRVSKSDIPFRNKWERNSSE